MIKIIANTTGNKKEVVKASNAAKTYQDIKETPITIDAVIQYQDDQVDPNSGVVETKTITCVRTTDGEYIGSGSPTIQKSVEVIVATFDQEELDAGIKVIVKSNKSKAGREFLLLDVL